MYHWIKDKEFLRNMRTLCSDLVNQLVVAINNDDEYEVEAHMVGSGAKHLETQNSNEPVDLDYNLNIIESKQMPLEDINEEDIKEYVRKEFNKILNKNDIGDCSDSTSCLTTPRMHFETGNQTEFSIDLAIVYEESDGTWFRLIHQKTGNTHTDAWFWNEAPHSNGLEEKVSRIKEDGHWNDVRDTYLDKKNLYLTKNDHNHPSFICYIEAVNEVYDKNYKSQKKQKTLFY